MGNWHYLIVAGLIGGLVFLTTPGSASPLAKGLAGAQALPTWEEGLVHKAHSWHCRKRKGWYRGKRQWHRHQKACRDYRYSERYRRYPPLPYYGYGEYGFPYDEWYWERRNWLWD